MKRLSQPSSRLSKELEQAQVEGGQIPLSNNDEELQELKEILQAEDYYSRASSENASDQITGEGESPRSPTMPSPEGNFHVSPLAAGIPWEGLGTFDREVAIDKRLAKIERLSRRLLLLVSIIFMFMVLGGLVAAFLLAHSYKGDQTSQVGMAQGIFLAQTRAKNPLPEGNNKTPERSPGSEESVSQLAGWDPPLPTSTGERGVTADLKFVGSRTSNKYHYPECKWAKTIIPSKEIWFASVEEARKAKYFPCPTCSPPLSDKPAQR